MDHFKPYLAAITEMSQRASCSGTWCQDKSVKFSSFYTIPVTRLPYKIGLLRLQVIGAAVLAFLSINGTIFLLLWPNFEHL